MKEIKLNNHFLIETGDPNKFLFMPNKKEDMEYMRFLYDDTDDSEKIFAIDPFGGPFISLGKEIEGIDGKISKIYIENSLIYIIFDDGK